MNTDIIPVEIEEVLSQISQGDSLRLKKEILDWIDPSNWEEDDEKWVELGNHPQYEGEMAILFRIHSGRPGDLPTTRGTSGPLV